MNIQLRASEIFPRGLRIKMRIVSGIAAILTIIFLLVLGNPAYAQGSRKDDIVFNAQGRPMAGATVRICTSSATGQPCSPLASIFSDAAMTQALANPISADGLGNYTFYAAPGRYEIEISGPGITTKQLPNVILPSDPSTPTFTSVTTTSGISAFSLTLAGNLTVSGSTAVAGTLTVGGAPVPSTNADNQWTSAQRFKGPIPYRDFTAYMPAGGCSSTNTGDPPATGTISSGSPALTVSGAADFKNGCGVAVIGAGPTATLAMASTATGTTTRVGTLVTFTVTSGDPHLVPGVGNGSDFAGFVSVSGCTDTNFNTTGTGWLLNFGTPVTSFTYNTTGSGGTSATGCTATFYIGWAHGITGSTTWKYYVAPIDAHGGMGAAIGPITVTNGNATLSPQNYNWIGYQATSGAREYAIWRDNGAGGAQACLGVSTSGGGYSDWGRPLPYGCPAYIPSAPPSSPTAQTLNTTIVSGGGTTSLVLAANASSNATSQNVYDDVSMFLASCITDAVADQYPGAPSYKTLGSYGCYIPYGRWPMNADMPTDTINANAGNGVSIHVAGTLLFQTWPWEVGANYQIIGQGNSSGIAPSQYFATTAVERGIHMPGGLVLHGSGIDVENFNFGSMLGNGIFIGGDPGTGVISAGISMNNIVSNVQDGYGIGVPLVIDGNSLFMTFSNMNFQPRSDGFPASILFTETGYVGNGHADVVFHNIFTLWHHIVIDSPGGQNGGQGTSFEQTGFWWSEEHGQYPTGGLIHLDAGTPPPGAPASARLAGALVSNMQNADASDKTGLSYTGQGPVNMSVKLSSTDLFNPVVKCEVQALCGATSPAINILSDSDEGNLIGVPQGTYNGPAVGGLGQRIAHWVDIDPAYGDIIGGGTPAWSDKLFGPGGLTLNGSIGSGSLSAGTYCMEAVGVDAQAAPGLTLPSNELCETVGASSSIPMQFYTAQYGGFTSLRLYYGASPGGESNYITLFSGSSACTTCTGTFTSTSGAISGTPPTVGTAYISALFRQPNNGSPALESVLLGTGVNSAENLLYTLRIGACTRASAAKMCVLGPAQADGYYLGSNVLVSSAAPAISSGFGSGASVTHSNGTAAFTINVGTGGSASSGVIGLATASNGWACHADDLTTQSTSVASTVQTASSATSATLTQYNDVKAATAWAANDILSVSCFSY